MKKKNSVCEFKRERSLLLLNNFRESLARQSHISAARAFGEAVNCEAPRFWVSEVRALHIIKRMFAGEDPTVEMREEKRKMFLEIFRRVKALKEKEPSTPLGDLLFRVINSPAPSFYMRPEHARKLIREAKRKRGKEISTKKKEKFGKFMKTF